MPVDRVNHWREAVREGKQTEERRDAYKRCSCVSEAILRSCIFDRRMYCFRRPKVAVQRTQPGRFFHFRKEEAPFFHLRKEEESNCLDPIRSIHQCLPELSFEETFVSCSRGHCSSACLLYTSPSPRDQRGSRMPSSA